MSGDSGPSKAQEAAQASSLALAQRAEDRELARDRALQTRILARQRARRFGQFGRRSLAFNPGNKDLGSTTTPTTPDPNAEGGKKGLSNLQENGGLIGKAIAAKAKGRKTVAVGTGLGAAPAKPSFRAVSA